MLGMIALAVGAGVAGLAGYAATRPSAFRVERRTHIDAPPEVVYSHLIDFSRWADWSPWEKLDPDMQKMRSGPTQGVGSVYEWEGNKKVGKGRMEITAAEPARRVAIQLDFIEPWQASNTTELTLAPASGGTDVTWAMTGRHVYVMKVMGIFMSMDKMIGKDFEKGLADLKRISEAPAVTA